MLQHRAGLTKISVFLKKQTTVAFKSAFNFDRLWHHGNRCDLAAERSAKARTRPLPICSCGSYWPKRLS